MPNKKVLIITPYFAPQSHAAVFRAYKLAKYLPEYGWEVFVLTVDCNYSYNEDPSLLAALPGSVHVHRARYIEPTLRGLRMALGGRDRTFKTTAAIRPDAADAAVNSGVSKRPLLARVYSYLLNRWLRNPDAYWTWRKPALRMAERLITEHGIPVIMTSADPFSCYAIGSHLKKKLQVKWVSDLRDPHVYCGRMHSSVGKVFLKQRMLEKMAVLYADVTTVASSGIQKILIDTYNLHQDHPIRFIPTGLDTKLLKPDREKRPADGKIKIVFTGEFLPGYGKEFFAVLRGVIDRKKLTPAEFCFMMIGRIEVNKRSAWESIAEHSLQEYVEFIDHVPQQRLYEYISDCSAGMLLIGKQLQWWCLYAKMVDYIALQKPVIALVPDPSEARTRLREAGLGIFLDGSREEMVETLAGFIEGSIGVSPDSEVCKKYFAEQQAKEFSKVLDKLNEASTEGLLLHKKTTDRCNCNPNNEEL